MIFNKSKELKGLKIGIVFSTFDLLHAGHIAMLSEAKNHCDYLIAGLQTDPTIDRPGIKNKPVQSIVERQIQLATNRNVDEVVVYETEKDLEDLLLILPVDCRSEHTTHLRSPKHRYQPDWQTSASTVPHRHYRSGQT